MPLEKKFTAPKRREARDQAEQWLIRQKGIRLVRQKQASDFERPGHDVRWIVTLFYQADDTHVLPETPADDDEAIGIV
jgi:hypothetical protein